MLHTYRSLFLVVVVILLQISFCLGHGDAHHTITTSHLIHHTTPTPTTTTTTTTISSTSTSVRHTPTHHKKHRHHKQRQTKTLCSTKTWKPTSTLTTIHGHPTHVLKPHTTVRCSTKVVWIYPTPRHHHHSKSISKKGKDHKQTTSRHTTTHRPKSTTTTTTTTTRTTTRTTHHSQPSSAGKHNNEQNGVNAFSEANPTPTDTTTIQDPNQINSPNTPKASSSPVAAAAAAAASPSSNGGNSDPNDSYTETQAVNNDGSTNTSLGLGLGLGVGCVAALGLAGLLVHNRRRHQEQKDQFNHDDMQDFSQQPPSQEQNTRWRPQSFMGVVASVVAKLPRSPSQRSQESASSRVSHGMAVGSGSGAVELARHPSDGSMRSITSQPPALARVDEESHHHHQHYQY